MSMMLSLRENDTHISTNINIPQNQKQLDFNDVDFIK